MPRTPLYIEANVIAASHQSGVGHAVRGMVTALLADAAAQHRYRLILIAPLRGRSRLVTAGFDGAAFARMPLPMRGYDRWASLRRLPPLDDLLGAGVYFFPNYGNWPLRRSPSATAIYDVSFLRHPDTVERNTRVRLQANVRRWVRRTSLVVTPSNFSAAEVMDTLGLGPDRVAVVPLGVDRSVFYRRTAAEAAPLLARLGLTRPYVLYFGNIEPRKNVVRLIKAYSNLPAVVKREYALALAGGNSWNADEIDREIVAAQARGDDVIRVQHRIADHELPALLSRATTVVHPAIYEGFGFVPLQAMACGTPVVVSNVASMPEVVGEAGAYVDPLDVDSITTAMDRMLTDAAYREALEIRGFVQAATFSWARTATALTAALDTVTDSSRPARGMR